MNMLKQTSGAAFKTRHLLGCALVVCMALFCGGATFADTVIGNFDIAPGGSIVPSQGEVLFSLNSDGTIAANVTVTNGEWIQIMSWSWGASNVANQPPVSGTHEGKADLSDIGISDGFGTQDAALICTACETDLSWTIGNPGEFTSVLQAFNCMICETVGAAAFAFQPADASTSSVDFVLEDTAGNFWGADAKLAPTPEPGSLALLGVGVLGVAGMVLRQRQFRLNTPTKTFVF
jgi:hypothetical protein